MSNRRPFIAGNWKLYKTIPESNSAVKIATCAVRNVAYTTT